MANNRQPFKLRDMAFDVLARQGLFSIELPAETTKAYQQGVASVLEQMISERLMPQFLQAVVDDDRATVKAMLKVNPELLLISPPSNLVIESQLTWNKFYAESALNMAAKRKQIEMIKIMLPYLDKIEQTEQVAQVKADVLTAWNPQDDIIIPDEYASYVQSLIDVFREETFPNGTKRKFSEKIELALSSMFDRLLPEQAVKLDDYLDPELFLLALYKAHDDKFYTFQDWKQRDAFCIRVIGLAQSVLSPETAKIFCEGLYYVVEENRKISDRAASLQLFGLYSKSIYRSSREFRAGVGFEYFVTIGGEGRGYLMPNLADGGPGGSLWENLVKQKLQAYRAYAAITSPTRPSPAWRYGSDF